MWDDGSGRKYTFIVNILWPQEVLSPDRHWHPKMFAGNLISFHGTDSAQHLSKNPLMRKLDPIGKKVTNEISLKRQAFLLDSNEINGRVNGDVT